MAGVAADPGTIDPIDWAAAVRAGQRLAPTGPRVTPAEAAGVVADLREFSGRAELAVRETTGLGRGLPVGDADVVDRRGWVKATAEGMAVLAAPLTRKMAAAMKGPQGGPGDGAQRRPARRSASSSASCRARSSGSSTRWAATPTGPAGCCWSRRTS